MLRKLLLSGVVALMLGAGCSDAPASSDSTTAMAAVAPNAKSASLTAISTKTGTFQEGPSSRGGPDLVLRGKIYTGLVEMPIAEEVAIDKGKIIGLKSFGGNAKKGETGKNGKQTILLEGAVAYPGFTDGHAHLIGIGMRELMLNLEGSVSLADMIERTKKEAAKLSPGDVLYGRGWIETGWPEGRFPTRTDLDAISTDIAILLERADGHAMVVNSKALELGGITDQTLNPSGGKIERDANGTATGMLIDNAMASVMTLVQAPSTTQRLDALQKGADVYAAYGWTGLHNMSVEPEDADLIARLEQQGNLPIRVYNALTPEGLDGLIARKPWSVNDGKVETRAVKFYIDGALGSRGALLKQPYSDQPDTDGLLLIEERDAKAAWEKALINNIQVTTHAIGDEGNEFVLDWYSEVLRFHRKHKVDFPRWRIEHAQIIDPEDMVRFDDLGIIASMQPSHAIGDLHFAPSRLGQERLDGAYAWRSLTDLDVVILGGSDAPVERGDPMIEFYAAVARKDLTGFSGEGWHPEQALSRAEALKIFTMNAALASYNEDKLGSLKIGKKADISVFSADIMVIPEDQIPATKAVMTIVDGEVVYQAK